MLMRMQQNDGRLYITGNDRSDGGSLYTQRRRTEFAVDQDIIQHQIDAYCHNPGFHGQQCLAALTQCAGIDLYHHEGQQTGQHDPKILFSVMQSGSGTLDSAFSL